MLFGYQPCQTISSEDISKFSELLKALNNGRRFELSCLRLLRRMETIRNVVDLTIWRVAFSLFFCPPVIRSQSTRDLYPVRVVASGGHSFEIAQESGGMELSLRLALLRYINSTTMYVKIRCETEKVSLLNIYLSNYLYVVQPSPREEF